MTAFTFTGSSIESRILVIGRRMPPCGMAGRSKAVGNLVVTLGLREGWLGWLYWQCRPMLARIRQ